MDFLSKILILNVILIVWKGTDSLVIVNKKCIPYLLGGLMFWMSTGSDMTALGEKLSEIYLSRLCWEVIIIVYMLK